MPYLTAYLVAALIAGHIVWGRRWMIDGTRHIVATYVELYRSVRR